MKHLTWETMDKSDWGDGPWQNEPDKEQWVDEATGLPCLLKRNHHGSLCGYVGISKEHPWYGKEYSDLYDGENEIEVHGGLTYSDYCREGEEGKTICHVPEPGEPEPLWWLGFNCGHCWDFSPASYARDIKSGGRLEELTLKISEDEVYRDREYIKDQCARLASQVAAA